MRRSLILMVCLLAGPAAAADAPKITVTSVDKVVTPDFLGDKPVKFAPAAQIANLGVLAGQVKKIKLHTHEMEDHIVYVVRGKAKARLGDEQREVSPGDLIAIPKRVPHSFDQIGSEPFVILVNATPGWDPLTDTRFLE
ncbi:MAG TPA: cupin domain-containing protein [Candidatus Deferrimicrobiaceae bacterium]|nr:cupin domain-containing protein [Candidatus Deferrimicrobiaceae bacterium]